jgi:hypothetical protein
MKYCFICFVLLANKSTNAQHISIHFDLDNAKQTVQLLQKKQLEEKELNDFVSLAGTKALIKKVGSSVDTAKSAIQKAALDQPLTKEESFRFQYDGISKKLPQFEKFISAIENKKDSITSVVQDKLGYYVADGMNLDVTLYGLLGSFSSGWAFGNDPNSFFIGLHFKLDDIIGIINTAEHELFHDIQSQSYKGGDTIYKKLAKLNDGYGLAYGILYYLYKEGTAEFVADLKEASATSPTTKELYTKMAVNETREQGDFYLVERMILDLYHNPDSADYNKVYDILFDIKWNNPAYYTGYKMTKALVKAYGLEYLKKSLSKDPLYFILDYLQLPKPVDEKEPFFSDEFKQLITKMTGAIK